MPVFALDITEEAWKMIDLILKLLVGITVGVSVYGIIKIIEWASKRKKGDK